MRRGLRSESDEDSFRVRQVVWGDVACLKYVWKGLVGRIRVGQCRDDPDRSGLYLFNNT